MWMWELNNREGLTQKNWCFWTVVLEKTLGSPLDSKIKPVIPNGNEPWIFIRRTDAEAETPIHWIPDAKSQLIGKDFYARKDCRQEEKGAAEDEMLGWHHWFNGHEFEVVKDRKAWCAAVHEVANSWTQFTDRTTYPHTMGTVHCLLTILNLLVQLHI